MRAHSALSLVAALGLLLSGSARAAQLTPTGVDVSSFFSGVPGEMFPGSNLIDGDLNDTTIGDPVATAGAAHSFWLAVSGETAVAVLDLGGLFSIDTIALQNTHNRGFNDRQTLDFQLAATVFSPGAAASLVGTDITTLAGAVFTHAGTMASVKGLTAPPDFPFETVAFTPVSARFIVFRAVTFNSPSDQGNFGAGLNEIRVFGVEAPEPGTLALMGLGLTALLWRRPRRTTS